ncbi:hypothetical protein GWD52_06150 [Enterobacteriaceae bacterium 4M9]|nr:hypothetical protein [Enterobacteriaceae bacterium 4M9]
MPVDAQSRSRRSGEAQDVMGVRVLLVRKAADAGSEHVLVVDGGYLAR